MDFLTTQQTAERLGIGLRRVQTLVQSGRLPASRFGRALMIKESDLALVAERKPGRPKAEHANYHPATIEATLAEKTTKQKAKKARAKKVAMKQRKAQ